MAGGTTTFHWFDCEVAIDRPGRFVELGVPVPDERWTVIDTQGHGHFWKDGYPTLSWISEPCTMGHDDCDAEGHYECKTCGDRVSPGTRTADPIWQPGWTSVTVTQQRYDPETRLQETTVYVCDEGTWGQVRQDIGDLIAERLADFLRERQFASR